MITLMRKAISATIGRAVMPVSYTWRTIEVTRRCFGRGTLLAKVTLVRPRNARPSIALRLNAAVCLPRSTSSCMKARCRARAGAAGPSSTPFSASRSVSSSRRSCSGALPLKLTAAPAARARATNWCSAQAPVRSSLVSAPASMLTRRAACRSTAASSVSRPPNSRQLHSPVNSSSRPSPSRRTSTAMLYLQARNFSAWRASAPRGTIGPCRPRAIYR